jgi:creatinine amidohydrolase
VFIPYGHLTQSDVIAANSVALIPMAAMETHGPHLPLATDGLIAEGIIERASELNATKGLTYLLPPLWLGASAEHADRAGTLSAEPEILISQICSIGEGLANRGVKRVLLFNAHGGNIAVGDIAALKLRTKFGVLAANAHWLDFGIPKTLNSPAALEEDVHGGWAETSIVLHLAPDLVRQGVATANPPSPPAASLFPKGPINWGWKTDDLARGGWVGRPDLASAALGAQIVDHAAQRLCETLADLTAARWPADQ